MTKKETFKFPLSFIQITGCPKEHKTIRMNSLTINYKNQTESTSITHVVYGAIKKKNSFIQDP